MAKQRKRHKETESPRSSGSSSSLPGQSKEPSQKKHNPGPVLIDDNSKVEPSPSVDATTPGSLSKLSKAILTDEQELKKARRDKNGRLMIAYPCKMCGGKTNRPIYESSPTNLAKHVASCTMKQREANSNQKLANMGVSGTGDIDPREVPQLCAIWCAQSAQPFASLGETSHLGMVHPTVIKNLPKRRTVSNDIAKRYTAVQESLIELFKNHKGAMCQLSSKSRIP
ncbi:hypothetical protein PGTUg99_020653 [Puccinia graminis f. sp. tritici]|uniref:Uncharacterized protein n=1 Tax=Puccinia graminis f. sp. tritici TaxID=56615 RepID=A0A5B0N246_PUCGR|nr:hypothetical protein PGTUg99_020653 [Puccinia graminis f. sp. tritici]